MGNEVELYCNRHRKLYIQKHGCVHCTLEKAVAHHLADVCEDEIPAQMIPLYDAAFKLGLVAMNRGKTIDISHKACYNGG